MNLRLYGLLFLLFVLALAIRLYRIDNQSLWFDEALTLNLARPANQNITTDAIRHFAHPPLHHYLLHYWFAIVGFGSFQARMLSAIFGALSVLMVAALARYLFSPEVGVMAALLLTISQYGLVYSQEARPYAMLLFFCLALVYLFVFALRERSLWAWLGFATCSSLVIYTHYHAVFLVATLGAMALLRQRRFPLPLSWWVGGASLGLVILAPWLIVGFVSQVGQWAAKLSGQLPNYFAVNSGSFLATLNRLNNGKVLGVHATPPTWTLLIGTVLFTAPALFAMKSLIWKEQPEDARRDRESITILVAAWIVPIVLALFAGLFFNVWFDFRYVSFCMGPYYILVALGIWNLRSAALRATLVVAIIAFSTLGMQAVYFVPYKENYRDSLTYLANHYQSKDCTVMVPFGKLPLQWSIYLPDRPAPTISTLESVLTNGTCGRVWLIGYCRTAEAEREVADAKKRLAFTWSPVEERKYFWVDVSLYVPGSR